MIGTLDGVKVVLYTFTTAARHVVSQQQMSQPRTVNKSCLVVSAGEIGHITSEIFYPWMSFSFDIIAFVQMPNGQGLNGYLLHIRRSFNGEKRYCFVSSDDANCCSKFFASINAQFPSLGILDRKGPEAMWSTYIFNKVHDFISQENYKSLNFVTCIGKQPDGNTAVLTPDVHINISSGKEIAFHERKYYWYEDPITKAENSRFAMLREHPRISTPLDRSCIDHLLKASRDAFGINFMPFVMTCSGALMAANYDLTIEENEECPIIMLYSEECGTGKTSSLKLALNLFGVEDLNFTNKATPAWVALKTSSSSLPIGIDDIDRAKDVESISVMVFNGGGSSTLTMVHKPRTSVLLTANHAFAEKERNNSRICYIPFESFNFNGSDIFKECKANASAAVGELLCAAATFPKTLNDGTFEKVQDVLSGLPHRSWQNYSTLLRHSKILCDLVPNDVLNYEEVMDYFTNKWGKTLTKLYQCAENYLDNYLSLLCQHLIKNAIPVVEVYRFLRLSNENVYLHRQGALGYKGSNLDLLKKCVKQTDGGDTNKNARFLLDCSSSTLFTKSNTMSRKCLMFPVKALRVDVRNDIRKVCAINPPESSPTIHAGQSNGGTDEESLSDNTNDQPGQSNGGTDEESLSDNTNDQPAEKSTTSRQKRKKGQSNGTGEESSDNTNDQPGQSNGGTGEESLSDITNDQPAMISLHPKSSARIKPVITTPPAIIDVDTCPSGLCTARRKCKMGQCVICKQKYHYKCLKLNGNKGIFQCGYC